MWVISVTVPVHPDRAVQIHQRKRKAAEAAAAQAQAKKRKTGGGRRPEALP